MKIFKIKIFHACFFFVVVVVVVLILRIFQNLLPQTPGLFPRIKQNFFHTLQLYSQAQNTDTYRMFTPIGANGKLLTLNFHIDTGAATNSTKN